MIRINVSTEFPKANAGLPWELMWPWGLPYHFVKSFVIGVIVNLLRCADFCLQQSESAMCMHVSPSFWGSLPPSSIPPLWLITGLRAELPVLDHSSPLAVYFTRSEIVSICWCYSFYTFPTFRAHRFDGQRSPARLASFLRETSGFCSS